MSTLQTQLVKKTAIIDSGDFNLSAARYLEKVEINSDYDLIKMSDLVIEYFKGINVKNKNPNNGKFRLIPSGANFPNKLIKNKCKYFDDVSDKALEKKLILDDILFNTGGQGTLGRVGIYNDDSFDSFTDGFILAIRNKDQNLNSKYLFWMLQSDAIKNEIIKFTRGATGITSIKTDDILNFEFPLPSLEIQEQIVKEIEGYQQIIDGCKQVVENYTPVIDIDPSWETSKLGEVCKFEGGTQPPKSTFINEEKDGYIRLLQIRDYKSDKNIVYIPKKERHKICSSEDIMIGRYGPPVFQILRGKSGAYNVALMKCIPDNNLITNEWLFVFLSSASVQKKIIDLSVRVRQSGVRPSDLNALIVPIPSLSVQEKIGKKLEQEKEVIEGNKELIKIYEKKINDKIKELF